ncbi:TetR/AcrR family transcriptional regulator [Oryzibacter oryziterrae]|uniref:TetR/AcrR family transcriptional regulator n=1 Tax=Oryzibacter oryziterrae TaxID=2766474 RepID=UPI001F392186|nr:TetR/AcrR family transcriptional regulator [Oryzibacter oryziterrae]
MNQHPELEVGAEDEPRPRRRDKEASKKAILEAGVEVFSLHGYDAATTKMIAATAGLNEQLITRYFGGKAGLLLAALSAYIDEEAQNEGYPDAADSVEGEIRQFLLHRHRRLLELQDFMKVFMPFSMRDGDIRGQLETIVFKGAERVLERLTDLQARGLIRADANLEAVGLAIGGQSMHISFHLRVGTTLDDRYLRTLIDEFARTLARGLAPTP